jgi:glycosyltransferase involved in cell wall biosynthesis
MKRGAIRSADGRRFRLALFTDSYAPQVNGVARSLVRLVDSLHQRGARVRVVAPEDPVGSRPEVIAWPSVPFWAYPQLRLSAPQVGRALRILQRWKPDLVHVATPFGIGMAGRAAARALGIPLVTSYHTQLTDYAAHYRLPITESAGWRYLRWFHNGGDRTYVPSSALLGDLRARGFERLAIWSRGVDRTVFHPRHRSEHLRAELGAKEGSPLVVYVGRIASEKGIATLMSAAAIALGERPGAFTLALAGNGPMFDRCREVAPEGTHLLGMLGGEALSRFYASADLFVFPSTTDTFGNVQLEAIASGVPVIAPDVAISREVIGDAGVFVPTGDDRALARTILDLCADLPRRRALADVALRRAAEWDWNRVFDALYRDYGEVARRDAVAAAA